MALLVQSIKLIENNRRKYDTSKSQMKGPKNNKKYWGTCRPKWIAPVWLSNENFVT
jgi:hypothetical protein